MFKPERPQPARTNVYRDLVAQAAMCWFLPAARGRWHPRAQANPVYGDHKDGFGFAGASSDGDGYLEANVIAAHPVPKEAGE